ncbi:MAG: Fic family protein, partial [Desulfococcaceae bacterium]
VTPQDEKILKILNFCQTPRSREEIQNLIKIKDREHFRKKYLRPLIKENLLSLTIPDKPQSSKQKYVTTEKAILK